MWYSDWNADAFTQRDQFSYFIAHLVSHGRVLFLACCVEDVQQTGLKQLLREQ